MRVWTRHKFQSSENAPESPPKECGAAAPQAATQVTMDSAAKRKVLPWPLSIDNELIGTLDRIGITIAGNVPDSDLVAGADLLATKRDILHRRASHVDYGRHITNDLRHAARTIPRKFRNRLSGGLSGGLSSVCTPLETLENVWVSISHSTTSLYLDSDQ
jgi:hypothetical protein